MYTLISDLTSYCSEHASS